MCQTRTTPCYPGFPNGSYWYGKKQTSQRQYPQWIDHFVPAEDASGTTDEGTLEPATNSTATASASSSSVQAPTDTTDDTTAVDKD